MTANSILKVEIIDRVIVPTQAELHVRVETAHRSETTDIRGRFVGPRCEGVSTVEVAYPLRPVRNVETDADTILTRQVIIPEPSLSDSETPFFYEIIVELWENGQRADERRLSYPLRLRNPKR
jgi:hypothetical protein